MPKSKTPKTSGESSASGAKKPRECCNTPGHGRTVKEFDMDKRTRTCSVDGCDSTHFGLSFCRKHYKRWKRNGTTETVAPKRGVCSVDGCGKPHYSHGYCLMHETRMKRNGSVDLPPKDRSFMDAPVSPGVKLHSPCIEWQGRRDQRGYGQLSIDGKNVGAHRQAWISHFGPVPAGMVIDHICRNPPCTNVEHLRIVTPKQNRENSIKPGKANAVSRYRGVTLREDGKWRVRVTHHGVVHHFGSYETEDEANRAAIAARNTLFTHNDADREGY